MKTNIIIGIIMLLFTACNRSGAPKSEQMGELTDTLKYKKIVLQVEGMTCTGCETTISKAVGELPGVTRIEVSHMDSLATVVFDTSLANVVVISESINKLGYKVIGEITR